MLRCDINCDMGEGIGNDEAIMPFISSANIACGGHAGDEPSMKKTILLAKEYNARIGAHPSFDDRENFGRTEMNVPIDEIYKLVVRQVSAIQQIAIGEEARLHHVKPHGALYNMAAKDPEIAAAIVTAVKKVNPGLILFGLSNSHLISEGEKQGLTTMSEVFADRTFQDDGSLTPRTQRGAMITDSAEAIRQVLQMIKEKTVTTVFGRVIPIKAETVCIHGDGEHAVEFAIAIRKAFRDQYINT